MSIRLTDCIAPPFYDLHYDIAEGKHSYYDLVGGRGSCKSSDVSLEIVLGIVQDVNANAVIYRKVGETIGDSVYEQIIWAIDKLGLNDEFHCTTSPYRCTYKPTGQRIIFKGLDKAKKSKSIKVSKGYIKFLWFEEFDEFNGAEEIRTVQQSVLRGGDKFVIFRSMNPPKSKTNWANKQIEEDKLRPDVYVSETNYLQIPPDWLGQQFLDDAEWLKRMNKKAYEHEYLGIPVGLGSEVFDNLHAVTITDDMINSWEWIYRGMDFGWYPDPFHFGQMYYDSKRRELWIFDEYRCNRTRNEDIARHLIKTRFLTMHDRITTESNPPETVADFRAYGLNCHATKKGANSVKYGMEWLQGLTAIHIDPARCPKTWKEFSEYEHDLDGDGEPIEGYPDRNNHCLVGSTLVNTPFGNQKIEDLVGTEGVIYAYDVKRKHATIAIYENCRATFESAEIWEVELENGQVIECTFDHPFLTENRGYVKACDLTENDDIVCITEGNA